MTKNKNKKNANNATNDDDYTFAMQYVAHFKIMCKQIMDLVASKHMTFHKASINIYKVITLRNICLNDDSVVKEIGIKFIVIDLSLKDKIKRIRIHMSKLKEKFLLVNKFYYAV